jgi:undecaprenyl-diphosphatase
MPKWLKAYGWWMFFWAFMVAISRIFVGKHYLGDVIVGILVGSIAGWLFAWLAGWLCKKFMAK